MAYKAFIPKKEILFSEVEGLLEGLFRCNGFEEGLMKFYPQKGGVVKDYKIFDGPLVQVESSLEGSKYVVPENSKILSIRIIGSCEEVNKFIESNIDDRFYEANVLNTTDIGTLDLSELEKLSKEGLIIKHEFGLLNTIDPTLYS